MAVDLDYYALLHVARDADASAIEAAVKKSMREWRKRTEAADLSVRQEAELKVKQIEGARATLLDQVKRAAYDRDLAGGVKQTTRPDGNAAPGGGSWLDQAERYLADGDYPSAAYAARQATQTMGDSARSWWVRSRANSGLNSLQDSLYEAKQAVALEENNADYHFNLGFVHEEMGQYNEAIGAYRRAGSCDPSSPVYELAVASVYLSTDRPDQALPILQTVYGKHPKDEAANYYLGATLIELAERVPKRKSKDAYVVTSPDEIHRMRELTLKATSLNIVGPDIRRAADNILQYLERMERKGFRPPTQWAGGALAGIVDIGAEFGFVGLIVGVVLMGVVVSLPLILVVSSFASFGDGNAGSGMLFLLFATGLGWLWWRLSWVPGWKRAAG